MLPAMLRSRLAPWWAALFLLAGLWTAAWPFTIDDAYIVARYAHRLAQGKGYTYNDGAVTDGVTGPLWLAPLVFGAALGGDPALLGKWLGLLASGAAVGVSLRHVQRRALGRRAAWLVVATVVTSLPFVTWAVAGLESGLAGLLVVLLACAVGERAPPRWLVAGSTIGALGWLRPELLVLAGVLWTRMWMRHRAAALRAALVALAAGALVIVFRTTLFGHLLPMSVSAKPAVLGHGFRYLGAALLSPRGLLTALCLLVAALRGGREARLFVAALAGHALAVLLAGGDWMPGRRLFAPLGPLLALTLATGLARFSLRRPQSACALVSLWLLASLYELGPELVQARAAGIRQQERGALLAARVCGARGPIAAIDIGALGSACLDHTFIDLGGLTEPAVAYAPGGHLDKRVSEAWLAGRAPGLILLHSRERPRVDAAGRVRWFAGYPVERRVLGFGFVQRNYEVRDVFEYADDYFYLSLVPRR